MHNLKDSLATVGTMVAILATAAGFSALAGTAHAQISGTIGGDLVDNHPLQTLCDPRITLADGHAAIEPGRDSGQHPTMTHCNGWPFDHVEDVIRVATRTAA